MTGGWRWADYFLHISKIPAMFELTICQHSFDFPFQAQGNIRPEHLSLSSEREDHFLILIKCVQFTNMIHALNFCCCCSISQGRIGEALDEFHQAMRFATEQKEIALICQYEIGAYKCKGVFMLTQGGVYPFSQSELYNLLFYVLLGGILPLYFCFSSLLSQFEPIFVSFTAILHVSVLKSCHLLNFTLTGCLYWWCDLVILEVAGWIFWDHFAFLGNCSSTPPLSSHQHLLLIQGKMLAYGRGRWAVSQKRIII